MIYVGLIWSIMVTVSSLVVYAMFKDNTVKEFFRIMGFLFYPMMLLGIFNLPLLYGTAGTLLGLPFAEWVLSYWWQSYVAFFIVMPLWTFYAIARYS